MDNFKDILSELIAQKGISVQKLSEITGINRRQIYFYLNGTLPTVQNAIKICSAVDCSLDYITGLSDIQNFNFYKNINGDLSLFLPRYLSLLKDNFTTPYLFSREHKFSTSIFEEWKKGATPSLKILKLIAFELGSSIDYLVGRI